MNIEDTIFKEGLAVNSIAMCNRIIEILKTEGTNCIRSIKSEKNKGKIKRVLFLLINQSDFDSIDIFELYREVIKKRVKDKQYEELITE